MVRFVQPPGTLLAIVCLALLATVTTAAFGDTSVWVGSSGQAYGNMIELPNGNIICIEYEGGNIVERLPDSTEVQRFGIPKYQQDVVYAFDKVLFRQGTCIQEWHLDTNTVSTWTGDCSNAGTTVGGPGLGQLEGGSALHGPIDGYLYATSGTTIRRINSTGYIAAPFVGGAASRVDGTGTAAGFSGLRGICGPDRFGDMYTIEIGRIIRKIQLPEAVVTTVHDQGVDNPFEDVERCVVSPKNYLYTADDENNEVRRMDLTTFDTISVALSSTVGVVGRAQGLLLRCDGKLLVGGLLRLTEVEVEEASPCEAYCYCPTALTADYTSDRIPDAAKDAYTTIALNENTWEVEFTIHNVNHITNGHVIVGKPNPRETAQTAFTPLVSGFDSAELWEQPSTCTSSDIDTPASSLGIDYTFDVLNCTKTYKMVFSLVDAAKQNSHCQLTATGEELQVGCSITLASTRAYDSTEPTAFLTSETSFTANITLPRNLNNEVSNLLYATLAKCNVLNFPDYVVDCRIPGLWTFQSTFTVSQSIDNWIDASSCVQSQTATATFVRCGLNSIPVGVYTEASANISATHATNTSEVLTFSLEYTLPRASSATASASLQNFIISIGMVDEKYYYAGADHATLYVETFDTSRLAITQLEMFNANGQVYALRDYPQFQLTETNNATHFLIEFRPSAIRQDSAFYRNGPHGVNLTFLFTAAGSSRRQMAVASANGDGFVVYNNINVRGDDATGDHQAAASDNNAAPASTPAVVLVAAIAGAAVVAVGAIAAVAVAMRRRRSQSGSPEGEAVPKIDASQV